jgi:hypothetical protein
MMTARSYVEDRLALFEYWRDYGHVWQVCATRKWVVRKNHFSFFPRVTVLPYLKPYGILHATQVHWQMRRVSNQVAILVKKGTRKVESFFDVRASRSFLQSDAHLFCD